MEMVRLKRNSLLLVFMAIVFTRAISNGSHADPVEDKQALLDFLNNMHHSKSHLLNWAHSSSVCSSWIGVTCNTDHSRVIALRLPGMGIQGSIQTNTLSRLSELQILSLRSNGISGSIPSDFSKLQNLTALYLQFNKFTGSLPLNFSVWNDLSILDLSNNGFNGSIPPSVSNLTHLSALNLANNSLSGPIPDINVPSLQLLNLANNNLSGNVPPSLLRFPSSVFSGNHLSTESGVPPAMRLEPPTPQPAKKKSKISEPAILGIVLGGSVLGFVSIALLMICCNSMRKKKSGLPTKSQKKERSSKTKALESQEKDNRLMFFEGCSLAFDLEDLLRASAEVLGKGTFGTTYKAALEDLTTVVVKRLKEVSVPKKEFEQQMEVVGNIRHQNVLALRAYYYSKDEKLMVYDYYEQGSVSALLHGKRDEGQNPLNWETRLRIAIGAARGIAHVHAQSGGKLVHGNIKASNIFLNQEGYGCLSDIGLATLMNPTPAPAARLPGYRAPEVTDTRKATPASDVYSFGVLLLELLTGKSPVQATGGEEFVHLVRWVNSVVREEWTAEVFDVELLKYPNIEEEMVEMLQVGMNCVVRMPEQRPEMPDVVKMVEDIRRASSPVTQSQAQSETNLQIAASASTSTHNHTPAPVPTQSETNMQIAASTSASTAIPAPAPAPAPASTPSTQSAGAGTSAPSTTSH